MRILILLCFIFLSLSSCKSTRRVHSDSKKTEYKNPNKTPSANSIASNIITYAEQYKGVKYQYGGTTKRGMDCSGLVQTSFKSEAILLPRTTKDLSKSGHWIDIKQVKKGDLLFFATKKHSRKINHVGIVTNVANDEVEFIHASTSKGVMISKLNQRYWYFAFVQARRVL